MEGNEEEIKEIMVNHHADNQNCLTLLVLTMYVLQACDITNLHFLHTSSLTCLVTKSQTPMELKSFQASEASILVGALECFVNIQPHYQLFISSTKCRFNLKDFYFACPVVSVR